ncbi:MAG: O-antigen ligase family protein, partial [Anaerolineales bacterium]
QRRRLPRVIILSFLGLLMGWASFSGWLSVVSRSQPGAVDLAPFVKLLNQPVQRPYRYLTLGFGDQLAKLSALTHNGTPDGSYHTARELSELRASGLGALDGAVWNPQGVVAVAPFLAHPERYGLRWVFANHPHYIPILIATGWRFRWMEGTVSVWDHLNVTPVAVANPPALSASPAAVWWGIAPLTALALVLITFAVERRVWAVRRKQVVQFLGMARRAAFGLTVVLLSLWWVHSLKMGALPLVYFTYQSVLVFASDLAAALTLGLWVVERGLRGERLRFGPRAVGVAGLLLTAAAALSGINSHDRALTLAFTLHLLLLAGLYLMLVNDSLSEAQTGKLFGGVLLVQAIVALVENWAQGTWLIPGLRYLLWPGSLSAASPGASVVENASGGRWLRAYGTLPHPNLLGGMLLIYLSAAIERFFATGRKRWLGLVAAGMITLALTFSRSAWAGLGVMIGASAFLLSCAHWRRARQALGVGLLAGVFTVLPLMPFLLARANVTGSETGAEQRSLGERALLVQASLDFIRARPWTGIGAGAFVVALAAQPDRYAPLEPVHNIPMLALAEMGAPGVLALLGFAGAVLRQMWLRRRRTTLPEAAWALALLGALAVGLFDHYWWTLSPVRMLFVVALGLWAGSQNTVQHGV